MGDVVNVEHHADDTLPLEPIITRLSDVQPEPLDWLWPGRLAVGKLNMLVGDPGLGKSLISTDIAARVSQAAAWPDGRENPTAGDVIILSAEDGLADTIRPRLDRAGADILRVHALTGVRSPLDGAEEFFDLSTDLEALGMAIEQTPRCRLVIIDPLSAYLGNLDSHNNTAVRAILSRLSAFAADHAVAMLTVSHLNKAPGTSAIYRISGSLAFVAACRVVWLVAKHPEDPNRRVVVPLKSNLGPDTGGLSYSVHDNAGQGHLHWDPTPFTLTAEELLSHSPTKTRTKDKLEHAVTFLKDYLSSGPQFTDDIEAAAEAENIAGRTLRRAKDELSIKVHPSEFQGKWQWCLPAATEGKKKPEEAEQNGLLWGEDD